MKLTVEEIAEACHETNRAYAFAMGDYTQLPWRFLGEEAKATILDGVQFVLSNPDASPRATHENWVSIKKKFGWTYGPKKDAEKKTHPCLKPYSELLPNDRAKDLVFAQVVLTLKNF